MNGGVEEEVHHRHHLPKMADDPDDEDDNDQHYQNQPYPHPHPHPYPPFHQPPDHDDHQIIYPPQPHNTINASPRPHLPRNTPPPHRTTPPPPHHHHQTPPPHQKPTPPPPAAPSSHKPRTPSPIPPLPPQKIRVPPAYTEYDVNEGDDYDTYSKIRRQICALIFILLLIGLTALILWLIYRPHEPKFAAVGAAVYSLNATSPPFISALVQLTILTKNPNRRTTLYYDGLSVTVYYRNQAITPAVSLPPLVHRTRSAVQMSPPVGGGEPVMVAADVAAGLAADEAYGVVALSWVMVGRVRYKAGGWLRIGSGRVYVRCDVLVGLKQATHGLLTGVGGGGGGAFSNPTGQVPLLGTPPCLLDI